MFELGRIPTVGDEIVADRGLDAQVEAMAGRRVERVRGVRAAVGDRRPEDES